MAAGQKGAVALFATCVGSVIMGAAVGAARKLLRTAGIEAAVPEQACCGQPAYNSGHEAAAREMALATIAALEPFAQVVIPSASCCGMVRNHYPALFAPGTAKHQAACALAAKTHELCDFLDALGWRPQKAAQEQAIVWHDSCASLRELAAAGAALRLLEGKGVRVIVPPEEVRQTCCGFGGLFSVKLPEVSGELGRRKARALMDAARAAGIRGEVIVSGVDGACLMHIEAVAQAHGLPLRARHVAEVLAG